MPQDPLDIVLTALEARGCNPRRSGRGWSAKCPAHEDKSASFSLTRADDGHARLRCFTGCDWDALVQALGLEKRDLYPPKERQEQAVVEATYRYVDDEGRLLYEVLRKRKPDGKKSFVHRAPDGSYSVEGIQRVLYHLPEVLDTAAAGGEIHVAEGEKCVEALRALGLTATCNSGGAKSWRPEFADYFTGAERAVVHVDNDEEGLAWARSVDVSLKAEVPSITVLRTPIDKPKADIADHLAVGMGLDELVPVDLDAAPLPAVTRSDTTPAESDHDGWAQPAPLGETRELPSFPVDVLPDWIAGYVEAIAVDLQVPVDLPAMVALAVLAAAAGGRVRVIGKWTTDVNLYVVVAMPPGAGKSPAFRRLSRPLVLLEQELAEGARSAVADAEMRLRMAEQRAKRAQDAAVKAPVHERGQLEAEALQAVLDVDEVVVPRLPRLLADDATPEALTSLLAEQNGRIAILSAEGGVFDLMGGRYSQGKASNLDVYLKGATGDTIRVDRKGRPPEFVERPALTVGITVQPDVLRSVGQVAEFRGRGITARFLYSVPEDRLGARDHRSPTVPDHLASWYDRTLGALASDLVRREEPLELRLTAEAIEMVTDVRVALEPRLLPDGDLRDLAEWVQKVPDYLMRLAALLHIAADDGSTSVGVDSVKAAHRLVEYLIPHAQEATTIMGTDPRVAAAHAVLRWIQCHGGAMFTRRDCFTGIKSSRFPTVETIDPALDLLVDHGYIRPASGVERGDQGWYRPTHGRPGRPPSASFEVCPHIDAE